MTHLSWAVVKGAAIKYSYSSQNYWSIGTNKALLKRFYCQAAKRGLLAFHQQFKSPNYVNAVAPTLSSHLHLLKWHLFFKSNSGLKRHWIIILSTFCNLGRECAASSMRKIHNKLVWIIWMNTWFAATFRQMHLKAPTHHPDSNQQPTAFIRPLSCILSDLFGRKVALNTQFRCAANSTVVYMFCAGARCNKQVALHENRAYRKTKRTQYSAPPTHLLAHRQSEWSYS